MKKRKFGPHQDMLSVIGLGGISIKNEGQKKAWHSSPIGSKHEFFLGKPIFTEGWKWIGGVIH